MDKIVKDFLSSLTKDDIKDLKSAMAEKRQIRQEYERKSKRNEYLRRLVRKIGGSNLIKYLLSNGWNIDNRDNYCKTHYSALQKDNIKILCPKSTSHINIYPLSFYEDKLKEFEDIVSEIAKYEGITSLQLLDKIELFINNSNG